MYGHVGIGIPVYFTFKNRPFLDGHTWHHYDYDPKINRLLIYAGDYYGGRKGKHESVTIQWKPLRRGLTRNGGIHQSSAHPSRLCPLWTFQVRKLCRLLDASL